MRAENSFSVNFIVRLDKKDKSIAYPYARVTVDGDRTEVSLRASITANNWDTKAEQVKGKGPEIKSLNSHIENVKFLLTENYRMLVNPTTYTHSWPLTNPMLPC